MFEPEKKRYLTRGVDETIPLEIQLFLWTAIDNMPAPKDYLQVFELTKMAICSAYSINLSSLSMK